MGYWSCKEEVVLGRLLCTTWNRGMEDWATLRMRWVVCGEELCTSLRALILGDWVRKKRNLNQRGTELCFLQFVESVQRASGDCASPAWGLFPSSCPSSAAQDLQPTLSRLLIVGAVLRIGHVLKHFTFTTAL